jgi:sentrin-specific protease 7
VDIFSKDFIFVPVNKNLHWSLAIICHPSGMDATPVILHYDSLQGVMKALL